MYDAKGGGGDYDSRKKELRDYNAQLIASSRTHGVSKPSRGVKLIATRSNAYESGDMVEVRSVDASFAQRQATLRAARNRKRRAKLLQRLRFATTDFRIALQILYLYNYMDYTVSSVNVKLTKFTVIRRTKFFLELYKSLTKFLKRDRRKTGTIGWELVPLSCFVSQRGQ